jgi:hypothetical protein
MKHFLFLLLLTSAAHAQTQLSGVVINGQDNSALPSASIFINNSTRGTTSNNDGKFVITGITETNFELVVSYTGFTTVSIRINAENINSFHRIKLFPKKIDLNEVVVMPAEKDGWEKWGKFFTENFIGTSAFASRCKIENPKVLRFFYDKKNSILKAYAHGSLIISNNALGYIIRYQLEEFLYEVKTRQVTYFGYTSFEDMQGRSRHREQRWEKNRKEAYYGSIMHFMRSLYRDKTLEEGFEAREKIRVSYNDSAYKQLYRDGNISKTAIVDTNTYTVVAGPDRPFTTVPAYIDLYNKRPFSFAAAAFMDTATKQKKFFFENMLQVIYKNAKESVEYVQQAMRPNSSRTFQNSEFYLVTDDPLLIEENGLYFNPINMMSSGYWGWCKMAEMLPSDYEPEKDK